MLAENRDMDHPRPNVPHFSRRGLVAPHPCSVRTAQSWADLSPGELVSRGPLASVSQKSVSITFEPSKASDLMRWTTPRSMCSWAETSGATKAASTAELSTGFAIRKGRTVHAALSMGLQRVAREATMEIAGPSRRKRHRRPYSAIQGTSPSDRPSRRSSAYTPKRRFAREDDTSREGGTRG